MLAISLNPIDWVTDAAGAVIGGAAETVLDAVVSWLEDGVRYVATAIAGELTGLSSLDLGSQTAQQMGGVMKWVALAVAVGSIMVSAVFAAFSSEGSLHDTIREIPVTLILMAGWFGLMTVWTEAVTALMSVWTTDALIGGLAAGVDLDPGIASFIRAFVALLLIIFLIVFFVEMLVLNHMLTFGVLIGQVAIAMRPVRPLRGVSGQMIRNMVTLSLVPALGVASLALSLGRLNEAGALSFQRAMGALAGIVVSVLMPLVVAKFLPLGGQSSSVGRSLIGAGAQVAATGAAVATGGALLAAGGLSKFVTAGRGGSAGGSGGGGGGSSTGGGGASGGGGGGAGGAPASAATGLLHSATSSATAGSGGAGGSGAFRTGAAAPRSESPPSGASPRPATSSPSSAAASGGASTTAAVASSVSSLLERGTRE
jgi:hypothetical protein